MPISSSIITRVEKRKLKGKKNETMVASGSADRAVEDGWRWDVRRDHTQPGKCCLRVPRQKHNAGRSF